MIIFETPRLIIRPYKMDDVSHFFRLNGNEEIMRYIRSAQTLEQTHEFLQKIIEDYDIRPGMGRWAMLRKDDQQFVGSFAVIPVERSTQLQMGYALTKENWGKGYASESVKHGLLYAFDELDLSEISGITCAENIPSQKVLLKNGFSLKSSFMEEDKLLHLYIAKRS